MDSHFSFRNFFFLVAITIFNKELRNMKNILVSNDVILLLTYHLKEPLSFQNFKLHLRYRIKLGLCT